jgi:hypothetical protein
MFKDLCFGVKLEKDGLVRVNLNCVKHTPQCVCEGVSRED